MPYLNGNTITNLQVMYRVAQGRVYRAAGRSHYLLLNTRHVTKEHDFVECLRVWRLQAFSKYFFQVTHKSQPYHFVFGLDFLDSCGF